jgi:hypothetical protein
VSKESQTQKTINIKLKTVSGKNTSLLLKEPEKEIKSISKQASQ